MVKYDKNCRYIASVGSHGSEPGQLNIPHTIAADANGNVYIGDRTNNRIQVFDNDLKLKTAYDQVGAPWAVCITPGPHQYLYSSNSNPDSNNAQIAAVTGVEVYKMEVLGRNHPRQASASRALNWANSGPSMKWIAGRKTKSTQPRSIAGMCRKSCCTPRK